MSGVDVLAVMDRMMFDELPLMSAVDMKEARAAVAELIGAAAPFAELADQLDATEDTEASDDEEWAKFRMTVKDYRRLRSALSRVRAFRNATPSTT